MEYVLTEHAREALSKRNISIVWLESVMNEPECVEADPVDPELQHRLARITEFGDRVLRVVVNVEKSPLNVVTAFFDRRRTLP